LDIIFLRLHLTRHDDMSYNSVFQFQFLSLWAIIFNCILMIILQYWEGYAIKKKIETSITYRRILYIDWINSLHACIQYSTLTGIIILRFILWLSIFFLLYNMIFYHPLSISHSIYFLYKTYIFLTSLECTKHSFKHINFFHTRKFRIIIRKKERLLLYLNSVHHKIIHITKFISNIYCVT